MRVHSGVSPVAESMRAYRAAEGITQREAGKRLGVCRNVWAKWERGDVWPDPLWRTRIRALLAWQPSDHPTPFAQACKAFRQREGCSQREAAALMGVDQRTWERWEGGHQVPTKYRREFWRKLNRSLIELQQEREKRGEAA